MPFVWLHSTEHQASIQNWFSERRRTTAKRWIFQIDNPSFIFSNINVILYNGGTTLRTWTHYASKLSERKGCQSGKEIARERKEKLNVEAFPKEGQARPQPKRCQNSTHNLVTPRDVLPQQQRIISREIFVFFFDLQFCFLRRRNPRLGFHQNWVSMEGSNTFPHYVRRRLLNLWRKSIKKSSSSSISSSSSSSSSGASLPELSQMDHFDEIWETHEDNIIGLDYGMECSDFLR
ncbi:hypothetical protein TEA_015886 [Camellia sinensis var. sinensis]|uniref:Uncharacterized protein n=1 Tax=Camellia sinensis var. sinensis TaxID=542762 RepID=A0A4S4DER5_CAMSN|nr:hypothetical protein TEA_015886 [Camellia sinensis var. sinensis]